MIRTAHQVAKETSKMMEEDGLPRIVTYPAMFITIIITIIKKKVFG
jgi:hypothetical protein